VTRFQRLHLTIGLAALALVACMAISQTQTQPRLGAEAATGSAYGTR
jgi:hypothetical protein